MTAMSMEQQLAAVPSIITKPESTWSSPASSQKSGLGLSSNNTSGVDLSLSAAEEGWARGPGPHHEEKRRGRLARFLTVYRSIFILVFIGNATALVVLATRRQLDYGSMSAAVAMNLVVALVMRLDYAVNALFAIFCHLSKRAPLWLRCACARIYGYGGLHSGCATAAVLWYTAYVVLMLRALVTRSAAASVDLLTAASSLGTLLLLAVMLVFAHPALRARLHNWFEWTHRFAGWTVVALFWLQTLSLLRHQSSTRGQPLGPAAVQSVTFWCLLLITALVVYPWTRLRLRSVVSEPLSTHAVRLHFADLRVAYGSALKLADQPLRETHPFAVIPRADGAPGFSVLVSHAGDWTRRVIDRPPARLWTRGIPQYGVVRVAALFHPVLVVATGSGIGPCLSLFIAQPQLACRVLWSTRSPVATYGAAVVDQVLRADPDAAIIDTDNGARPDLVSLAFALYRHSSAEAVVVVSNPRVTRMVVEGLEARRVPVFGPIFDS